MTTNNPTIDGVSRELLERVTKDDIGLSAKKAHWLAVAELRALLDAPAVEKTNELREHCKQCAEVVKTWPEWKRDCLGGAPAVERQEPAKCGQCGSTSVDICNQNGCGYLESGNGEPEVAALQSTIARLEARVAELESGRGELVAYTDMKELNRLNAVKSGYMSIIVYRDPGALVAPLYTAPPAPVAVVLPERDLLRDKIAEAIGGDTYDCTRVWSAWGVGTMDQNDFVSLVEQEDRLYEIVDACLDATAALNGVKS